MAREDTAEDGCSQIEVFGSAPPTAGESMLQPYRPHMAISEVNTPGALDVASNQGGIDAAPQSPLERASTRGHETSPRSQLERATTRGSIEEFDFPKTAGSQMSTKREETGDRILRRGEAALARTRLPVWEWSKALFHAKEFLLAARKEYGSGPSQLLQDKKPTLADLARRIKEVERQIEQQLQHDDKRHQDLMDAGDFSTFISSMEHGWWLREELYGKGSQEVQEHVAELVLMLNNASMHLVNLMVPEGNDSNARLAYDYLQRAQLLTEDSSDALSDAATKKRLQAVTFNNMGCYYERRNRLLKSLEFLDRALKLELDIGVVEDPSGTHLNMCRVLSRLNRHDAAVQHARCAAGILEDLLLNLQEELEEEKSHPSPTTPPSDPPETPLDCAAPPPLTAAENDTKHKKRQVSVEDRLKDAVAKFAIANYNVACELEQLHRFADALDFYRKAAEGSRQIFGSSHELTVRFRQDLAGCSKLSQRHHSKKTLQSSPKSALKTTKTSTIPVEGRIPYGCGVIAGPTTVVAGTRAGVKFGFETTHSKSLHPSPARTAQLQRISLGTYGEEELRSMFSNSRASTQSLIRSSIRRDEDESLKTVPQESDHEFLEHDSQYDDLREIIADAASQEKILEPMVLEQGQAIAGFWVDKRDHTAYHVAKIGPVSSESLATRIEPGTDKTHRSPSSLGTGSQSPKHAHGKSQTKSLLKADSAGDLAPMDPRRALEPERMIHLENIAKFLYEKVGPLPEFTMRLTLRVFEEQQWKTFKKAQRDKTWLRAKNLIQRAAATGEKNDAQRSEQDNSKAKASVAASENALAFFEEPDSSPWQDSRMLLVKLSISFESLKETIASECRWHKASVELMAKDLEGDFFSVASEHGLRSTFATSTGTNKSCEMFCSGSATSETYAGDTRNAIDVVGPELN